MTEPMEGLLAAVPAEPRDRGPSWLVGLRRRAAAELRDTGFPGRKHEKWRFTSVRDVVRTPFETAGGEDPSGAVAWADERLGDDGTWRLVIADGRAAVEQAGEAPSGVTVRSLAEVLRNEPALVEGVLGRLAPSEHFAALSNALFEDGAVVVLEGHVETPVHLVHVATPGETPRAAYPRLVVVARGGSQATLVESFLTRPGEGKHLTNAVAEVAIDDGARLEHVRVTEGEPHAMQLAYLAVRLGRDAYYGSRAVALGGALTRLELTVRFEGPGSEAVLDGVYHVDRREHVDHQVLVTHAAGHCASHVTYRGLLDGKGHAVFNAMSIVERDAQQSSAHQENRNLLLSDDATIDTKPHLEIDADDISASHGAAVGAVDDQQLFYLRSRAIPEAQARDLLTFAFVRELLDRLPHAPLVGRTSEAVLARLPHGDAIREVER
jgi:Fe-S cluster assembly protein SufD